MQQLVRDRRFALLELILVVLCGAVWMVKPEWGIWFILIALLPLILRVMGGGFQFEPVDWLVAVFAATAWTGYWAAYDQAAAWNKAWLVMTAVLLYFSLRAQPRSNRFGVSVFLFCLGVGIAFYYFLTHDFIALPRKLELVNQLGRWIMTVRPQTGWTPIHPNYVAGMIALTTPFIFHAAGSIRKRNIALPAWLSAAVVVGLGVAALALAMATSRGVIFAIVGGAGVWLLWRVVCSDGIRRRIKSEAVFPVLLLVYLCAVVAFLYAGPARSGSLFTGNYFYGDGSRAELFARSLYLLFDHPITGGGLDAFPGLYSQYLLDIPFYNVPNSHNLFLDVGIEQGLFGGLAFFALYIAGLWAAAGAIVRGGRGQTFRWVVLFSLTVAFAHGMVDDYLYNGVGTMFSLFLVGLSVNGREPAPERLEKRFDLRTAAAIALLWIVIAAANFNQIRAVWYANIGAVQLAKVELDGFPNAGWAGTAIIPRLDEAEASLRAALTFDPANRTANQRLGIISMLRRDFVSAAGYLEVAHARAPHHRGIVKLLAYCYTWLGDADRAGEFLAQVPEAVEELDVYVTWWAEQGRDDLSDNAALALDALQDGPPQP